MNTRIISAIIFMFICLTGCSKFLLEKSDKRLVIPSTVGDLQALMDGNLNGNGPTSGDESADDFYITNPIYNALNQDFSRNLYSWKGEDLYHAYDNDWSELYTHIYFCTVVLENIDQIERNPRNATAWDNVKGQALAVRAYKYLQAASIWAKAYDPATADNDLGIPLRQTESFLDKSVRVSVKETYDVIINSLKEAIPLLPYENLGFTRAGKPMAYATLARAYLFMRNYEQAGLYADSALRSRNSLLSYQDDIATSGNFPFPSFENNREMIYLVSARSGVQLLDVRNRTDQALFDSYHEDDLRKKHHFTRNSDGTLSYKGNYLGSNGWQFSGISTPELYLMRAECYARAGKIEAAMDDLNVLLKSRWDQTKVFVPLTAFTKDEALRIALLERRKEMIFRGVRWPDIKRLNKEGAEITLTREIDGVAFQLTPNENRYALPIPESVIQLSGMPQNPQ